MRVKIILLLKFSLALNILCSALSVQDHTIYNHVTSNLTIYSHETSQNKLSEAQNRQSIIAIQVHDTLH